MHGILMIAFSLFTVFNSFAIDAANIDEKIAEGIQAHRAEAFVAREIHKVTHRYDTELNELLDTGAGLEAVEDWRIRGSNIDTLMVPSRKIVREILESLWQSNIDDTTLQCIRALTFAKYKWEENGNTKDGRLNASKFFKLWVQNFYHSRTLFGIGVASQIVSLYDPQFQQPESSVERICLGGTGEKVVNIEDKLREITEKERFFSTNRYNFYLTARDSYDGAPKKAYIVTFKKKTGGAQFGGYAILKTSSQSSDLRKYFVKAYYGYPAKTDLNSEKAFGITTRGIRSDEARGTVEAEYQPVNLKELFVYKVLELIGLGPKVHFLINPYLKDGIFIITEDLNTDDTEFVEMGKMPTDLETRISAKLLDLKDGLSNDYSRFNAVTDMLEIDTINRIFHLTDANDGNFGYMSRKVKDKDIEDEDIEDEDIEDKDAGLQWLQQHHDFRIIDFLVSGKSDSYVVSNIYDAFLEGNSISNYRCGKVMDNAVCRKIPKTMKEGPKRERRQGKHRAEKLFFGEKVIASLDGRFERQGGLDSLLQAAKQFVAEFIRPNGKYTIADNVGLSHKYVDDSLADLDAYISGISTNYTTLSKAIGDAIKEDAKSQPHA